MKIPLSPRHACYARQLRIAYLFLAIALTGCSSGSEGTLNSGVGTGGTGTLAKVVTGTVADGYLVNAKVFLDKNGNYRLDEGEPSATTDSNGAYKLNIDPADMGRYPIVALAVKGATIDKDTNQYVANSFVLSIPKERISGTASNNFISPISSQLHEMLETGIYTSIEHATESLGNKIGLPPGTDLLGDYVVSNNTDLHSVARKMAKLMGNPIGYIDADESRTTVDVNRYRSLVGTIFSSMATIKGCNTENCLSDIDDSISTALTRIPSSSPGHPYLNMSTAYREMKGRRETDSDNSRDKQQQKSIQ